MNFSEALVHAHSSEENESQLVTDIVQLLKVWEQIESFADGSAEQLNQIKVARDLVDGLRTVWKLDNDEIVELGEHAQEFQQWIIPPPPHLHRVAG